MLYVKYLNALARFKEDRAGVTAVEYGVIAAAVVVGIVLLLFAVGNEVFNAFNDLNNALAGSP